MRLNLAPPVNPIPDHTLQSGFYACCDTCQPSFLFFFENSHLCAAHGVDPEPNIPKNTQNEWFLGRNHLRLVYRERLTRQQAFRSGLNVCCYK